MNNINTTLDTMCKPLLLFLIFEAALITYNLTQFKFYNALINVVQAIFGGSLIYMLCRMDFEIAAWILLAIVPFFFVSLIALLIITQLVSTNVSYWNDPERGYKSAVTNTRVRKLLGLPAESSYEPPYDYVENPAIDDILNTYSEGSDCGTHDSCGASA